jgi:hypothetical protein
MVFVGRFRGRLHLALSLLRLVSHGLILICLCRIGIFIKFFILSRHEIFIVFRIIVFEVGMKD